MMSQAEANLNENRLPALPSSHSYHICALSIAVEQKHLNSSALSARPQQSKDLKVSRRF